MASYISSNDNRLYVGLETAYGQAAAVSKDNRIPAVKLTARQRTEKAVRKDKTGTRTFLGDPAGLRRSTSFALTTYTAGWTDQTHNPTQGPLFQACLGMPPSIWNGGTIVSQVNATRIAFASPHGLTPGQAITLGGEIRFVAVIPDTESVVLNAPFSVPVANSPAGMTATYRPGAELPSVSIYDYWSPGTAVQRMLCGAAVNQLKVNVNGDFHEFEFSGDAADLVDSSSYETGQGGLQAFPQEPALNPLTYSIIPGHLGQAWLGTGPTRFFTVTSAQLTFDNGLQLRDQEFGSAIARGITPGIRNVSMELKLFQQDDAGTQALYQAARQRSPIGMMLQLGQQQGQLFGIYMKGVVPEVPEFDDSEKRQQWHFLSCRAQGVMDDEISIAFG